MNLHIQVELLYTWKSLWSPKLQDFSLLQVEKSKPNLHEASVQFAMNWALIVSFPLPLASLTMQEPKCDDVHIKTLMAHIKHLKKWNIRKHPITAVFFIYLLKQQLQDRLFLWSKWPEGFLWGWPFVGPAMNDSTNLRQVIFNFKNFFFLISLLDQGGCSVVLCAWMTGAGCY